MINWRGWNFPDDETHYQHIMGLTNRVVDGVPTYQYNKYETARGLLKNHRRAIDIGANVGLWSRFLVKDFQTVEAFEPVGLYADCFEKNVTGANLYKIALGNETKRISMARKDGGACGDTAPATGAEDETVIASRVQMRPLDYYDFDEVDLMKVDCEGFELFVLEGARETILRNKPIIVVEQKPTHGKAFGVEDDAGAEYLKSLGAKLVTIISGDYIFRW